MKSKNILSRCNADLVMLPIYLKRLTYEEGPKNNRNLNVARELEVVARCAARDHESRQYFSSLSLGVDLG
jgi:hypothetical protein